MATLFHIHSLLSNPTHPSHRPGPARPKATPWWTPLFGWSNEPDYITKPGSEPEPVGGVNGNPAGSRIRAGPGMFTEEKAKELRRKTRDSFHDVMYHSAIASRLASDVSDS